MLARTDEVIWRQTPGDEIRQKSRRDGVPVKGKLDYTQIQSDEKIYRHEWFL